MANEQFAFLLKENVPTREEWQAAINDCGFSFQLDPELKVFEHCGFLPCILEGEEAGVEVYYDGSPDLLEEFSDIAPGQDYCISFRWGGSMMACASAMILSYTLAARFGAIVSYEGEEPNEDLDLLLEETKACIQDGLNES